MRVLTTVSVLLGFALQVHAAIFLREDTTSQEVVLPRMLDDDDAITEKTGLTIANTDVKLFKSGATSLVNKNSGGATELANGLYYVVLDATDTDTAGPLVMHCKPADALDTRVVCEVLPTQVFDSMFGGDFLQVDAKEINSNTTAASELAKTFDNDGTGGDMDLSSLSVTGTSTYTGNVALQNGLTVSRSTADQPAISATGNGTGAGMLLTGGSGVASHGLRCTSGATLGIGLLASGSGTGPGILATGGMQGDAMKLIGGTSAGEGIRISTSSGNGISVTPAGTNMHGVVVAGGSGGTCDGINVTAGSGGVPIRGDITGSIIGSIGSVTNPASIWSAATSGMTASGSIGKLIVDNLNASVGDLAPQAYFDALFDDAPTFADAMDDHGYTMARAQKIDRLPPSMLVSSTIDTTSIAVTQTSFALANGPSADDALNGAIVIVTDASDPVVKSIGLVKDYVGSTKKVTLVTDPEIFNFAHGDTVDVIATGSPAALWLGGSP